MGRRTEARRDWVPVTCNKGRSLERPLPISHEPINIPQKRLDYRAPSPFSTTETVDTRILPS